MEIREELLLMAIDGCRTLLDQTVQAKAVLRKNNSKEIDGIAALLSREVETLQENEKLLTEVAASQLTQTESQLQKEWLGLHKEAQRETEAVLTQLKGSMAVTRQELVKLRTGKQIAAGYHSNLDRRGRKLNING